MAEECTESCIAATSSTASNWWSDIHASSLSSWNGNINPWQPPNPNSNSSSGGDEDLSISTSFTNASNQSGLSVDSSRGLVESSAELIGEAASDNHLWSHVLLSVGSRGEMNNTRDVGKIASCDYLKKMDNGWEFTNQTSNFNNFEKDLNGFNEGLIESERMTKLSNLVSNWSIALPEPEINHQFEEQQQQQRLSCMDWSSQSDNFPVKQTVSSPTSYGREMNRNFGSFSCYGHELKVKDEHHREIDPSGALLRQFFNPTNGIEYQVGLNNSIVGDNNKFYYGNYGMPDVPSKRVGDVASFTSFLSKPSSIDIRPSKPVLRSPILSDRKKQGIQASSQFQPQAVTRSNVRGHGITGEGKKKRSEDNAATVLKKQKQESSAKVPKVKLADKITALQQIVSPFGKTDTASVLWEAIGCIKFLQEQVQLLSNPYMKTNANKNPWGSMDRKDGGDVEFDLKSRGLCLVPISCTPPVYRENTGSDFWTPTTYRGCLYR